MIEITT